VGWARDFWTAARPHATGGVYVNFLTADEGQERVKAAYDPEKYGRLVTLKNKYDPLTCSVQIRTSGHQPDDAGVPCRFCRTQSKRRDSTLTLMPVHAA